MEKSIVNRFTPDIVTEAAQRFGIGTADLTNMNGFQNFVYRGSRDGRDTIIRIAHESHRSEEQTLAEFEFIAYLSESGMPVSKPLKSRSDRLVEVIERDGDSYVTAAFEMEPGRKAKIAEESAAFYERIGRFTGKMHRLSLNFKPVRTRYQWYENAFITRFKQYVPEAFHPKFDMLMNELLLLPKDEHSYGLIHGDISHGNYLNDDDHPNIIDFDQCEYSWFASEIAIPLFYEIPIPWVVNERIRKDLAKRFFVSFMNGYAKEHSLSEAWLGTVPLFINLRQAGVVSAIYRSFGYDEYIHKSEWDKQALLFYTDNILNDRPYIDLDFAKI